MMKLTIFDLQQAKACRFLRGGMSMSGHTSRMRAKTTENITSWLIMLPGLILMTFFVWEPLVESVRMSMYKTRNVELVRFIGLDNFISVVGKDDFMQALANTFSYTFWSLLLGFALPVLLAILIGELPIRSTTTRYVHILFA